MSKALNRVITKRKEKKARRKLEKDSKHIIDDYGPIASALDHYGMLGSPYDVVDKVETEDDTSSVSSFSTMATMNDNPGAGCTVDKYFYQPVGRRIEKLAFRIAMPLLSPFKIFQYIKERRFRAALFYNKYISPYSPDLNSAHLAGLKSLLHQTQ